MSHSVTTGKISTLNDFKWEDVWLVRQDARLVREDVGLVVDDFRFVGEDVYSEMML